MERDADGRRWMAAYLKIRPPLSPPRELHCPDHPNERLIRVLGQLWVCRLCIRDHSRG